MSTEKKQNYAFPIFEEFQKMAKVEGAHKGFVTLESVARNANQQILVYKDAMVFPYRKDPFVIKLTRDEKDEKNFYVDAGKKGILPLSHDEDQGDWAQTLSRGVILITRANVYQGWDIIELVTELSHAIEQANVKKFEKIYSEAIKRKHELQESRYSDIFAAYWSTLTFKQTKEFVNITKKALLEKMPHYFEKIDVESGALDDHMNALYQTNDDEIIKKAKALLSGGKKGIGFHSNPSSGGDFFILAKGGLYLYTISVEINAICEQISHQVALLSPRVWSFFA